MNQDKGNPNPEQDLSPEPNGDAVSATAHNDELKEGWPSGAKFCIALAVGFILLGGGLTCYDLQQTVGQIQAVPENAWQNPGIRGDFWGGHFAATSGMAGTLFFFAALLLQHKELKLQRIELKRSVSIAAGPTEAV